MGCLHPVATLRAAMMLTALALSACTGIDFWASDDEGSKPDVTKATADGGADGGVGPSLEAGAEGGAERVRTIYVFGGKRAVNEIEVLVTEAYAAPILEDGSLGLWERAPTLDVGRSDMAAIVAPDGLLVLAGGNGTPLQDLTGNYEHARDDVGTVGADSLGPWRSAPALGSGNGRWAAAGTFASGRVYVSGGTGQGDVLTDTVMAAPVIASPSTLQGWQSMGKLPVPLTEHGFVALGSHVYVLGGWAAPSVVANTWMTTLEAGGALGTWQPTAPLPQARGGTGVVAGEDQVFVIGGEDDTPKVFASVLVGTPKPNGELAWQETAPLNDGRAHVCTVRANGRLYVIGGDSIGKVRADVEVGEVSGPNVTWRNTTPMLVERSGFGCAAR